MLRIRLGGGSEGMLPRKKFLKILFSEMASDAFLGLKTSLGSLRFSLGIATEFTHGQTHGDWCPSALVVLGTPV